MPHSFGSKATDCLRGISSSFKKNHIGSQCFSFVDDFKVSVLHVSHTKST